MDGEFPMGALTSCVLADPQKDPVEEFVDILINDDVFLKTWPPELVEQMKEGHARIMRAREQQNWEEVVRERRMLTAIMCYESDAVRGQA